MPIYRLGELTPTIAADAFIAPDAQVIGDVQIGAGASIWFGCVLRGDVNFIRVGAGSNIQDGTIVHVTRKRHGTIIGDHVLIGHQCMIHGCELQDHSFIGLGATVMDACVVEPDGMVAAGALLTPGKVVKSGQLWAGAPAKYLRDLSADDIARNRAGAAGYVTLAQQYRADLHRLP
jgi:gamma-carbonic anhydrase